MEGKRLCHEEPLAKVWGKHPQSRIDRLEWILGDSGLNAIPLSVIPAKAGTQIRAFRLIARFL
jgi:hypothetical protein